MWKMHACVMGDGRKGGGNRIGVIAAVGLLLFFAVGAVEGFAQSAAEKAMETLLRDMDEMVVNERMGCYVECDTVDAGGDGFGFDEAWFMGTSGEQADDMPYEYFHYYVKAQTVMNAMGVPYRRFDLHRARMIMAVGDKYGTYALEQGNSGWWEELAKLSSMYWDDKVLVENVVLFDFYCWGTQEQPWMGVQGGSVVFDSRQGHFHYDSGGLVVSNVPPVTIDVNLGVTSPEAAMELKIGAGAEQEKEARELMLREAMSYSIRAEPITGAAQLSHPENHYLNWY